MWDTIYLVNDNLVAVKFETMHNILFEGSLHENRETWIF